MKLSTVSSAQGSTHIPRRTFLSSPQERIRLTRPSTFRCRAQTRDLNRRIAEFYDNSSGIWEDIWGEHMHHGIYRPDNPPASHRQAQIDLIEEILKWADVRSPQKILDVGCGIGGSARYLTQKFGGSAKGVTLSPAQASRAMELTKQANLADRVSFDVCDALNLTFNDATFDLIWSLESGEHMPNKKKFVAEMVRVCEPGGQIVVVTWCHRPLESPEATSSALTWQEKTLLDWINAAYALPDWVSIETYQKLFDEYGLVDVKVDDWSSLVEPFWGAVIKTALTWEGVTGLLKSGSSALTGALVMPLMQQGFRMNTIKFNLITGRKRKS